MLTTGNRKIKIKKQKLIDKIKENKKTHIELYEKAVIAYKKEALEQLGKCTNEVNDGTLDIKLDLVTPIDNSQNYDDILEMFEWEVEDEIELGQNEFREYVQDETDFAQQAMFSNTLYSAKF
jgi:enoyl reductase-like protein